MPVNVVGSTHFKPTPAQIQRIQDFYHWAGYKKLPGTIVLVHPKDFQGVVKQVSQKPSDTAATVPSIGRTYLNAALFDSKDPTGRNNLEWTLAHEAEHLNSPESYRASEMDDKLMDEKADHMMKQWNGRPGRGYRTLQSQISKLPGEFGPTRAPIATSLQAPQFGPPVFNAAAVQKD